MLTLGRPCEFQVEDDDGEKVENADGEEPSAELKAAAAAIAGMMKTAAGWPGGADKWVEGLVKKGKAGGLPELCGGMCASNDVPAVKVRKTPSWPRSRANFSLL